MTGCVGGVPPAPTLRVPSSPGASPAAEACGGRAETVQTESPGQSPGLQGAGVPVQGRASSSKAVPAGSVSARAACPGALGSGQQESQHILEPRAQKHGVLEFHRPRV